MSEPRLAFEVWIDDYLPPVITWAKSKKSAQWNCVKAAREAGYYLREWPRYIKSKRVEYFDQHPKNNRGREIFSRENL